MRKFTAIAFVLLVVIFAVQAQAQVCFPSGNKTADAALYTGRGTLCSIVITTDGTNDCSVILYDNTAASGTAILPTMTCPGDSSTSGVNTCVLSNINLGFSTGLYADMTVGGGGSCTYNVGRRSGR